MSSPDYAYPQGCNMKTQNDIQPFIHKSVHVIIKTHRQVHCMTEYNIHRLREQVQDQLVLSANFVGQDMWGNIAISW